jgi:hypothetical protein
VTQDFTACKKNCKYETNISKGQIVIPFAHYSRLLPDDSTGRTATELWWTSQEFYSVDIVIPPWFSMLMYQLGHEQYARWWPQFRDVVLPHRQHDGHDHYQCTTAGHPTDISNRIPRESKE